MRKLTVDREHWCRGELGGESGLLNDHGNKCCLGFLALDLGFTEHEIQGVGDMSDFDWSKTSVQEALARVDDNLHPIGTINTQADDYGGDYMAIDVSDFHQAAIKVNDNLKIKEATREEQLIELFGNHDVELSFTGTADPGEGGAL